MHKFFNSRQSVKNSFEFLKIPRVLKIASILIISVSVLFSTVFASSPSVDGRFYGDGDDARYTLIGVNSNGWGNLYTRMENDNVYVVLVVDRSANDTVIGQWNPNPSDRDYLNSAGWNNRPMAQLINSEFAEFTFTICEGAGEGVEETYTWQQAFAYDSDGDESPSEADWVSDNLQAPGSGIAPPGMVSASSITWNLNNYALAGSPSWDVTLGGTRSGMSQWKSPYDNVDTMIGVSGYPAIGDITFDSDHGWEWPMVYEWAVPLDDYIDNCSGYPLFVVSGTSHHSPSKVGPEDIPIDEIIVPEFIEFGDLPDGYGTLLASNGARHNIPLGSAYLGSSVDPESDGQPNVAATGDDNSGDDEDGIVFLDPLTPGTARIQVTAGTAGYLSAFIDFDNNGGLDAVSLVSSTGPAAVATGTISDTHLSVPGTYILTITVPAGAANTIYSRFRFTTNSGDGGASSTGLATTGEVEDYLEESEAQLTASLTLVKIVVNDDGGSANVDTFSLDTDATNSLSFGGAVEDPTDTFTYSSTKITGLTPGAFTLRETATSGYTEGTWSCDGGNLTNNTIDAGSVTLAAGDDVTCTITNDDDEASIDIEKSTNGEDADTGTGPLIAVGGTVTWEYVVENTGNVTLEFVVVTDDIIANDNVNIDCGDLSADVPIPNVIRFLEPGEFWTCTATGTAILGQYANVGTVTTSYNQQELEETDPSHYFGIEPSLDIEKSTNFEDADTPTGPLIKVGGTVTWRYVVENTGNLTLTDVAVTDDIIADDTQIDCGGATGTENVIASLLPGSGNKVTCTATGIAILGQYANVGTASSNYDGEDLEDTDPSHYFGTEPTDEFEKTVLPDTGFAPNVITQLPLQPENIAYASYNDIILSIPQLGIFTSIVGVPQEGGEWNVNWLGRNAGWLQGTSFPTWEGNTVITGHVWDANNNPGLFANLKDLQFGDQFFIHFNGQVYTYEVRLTNRVSPNNLSVLGHSDYDIITLITCENWNIWTNQYSLRRTVQAVLIDINY